MAKLIPIYRIIILVISALAELGAGGTMLFAPSVFFQTPTLELMQLAHAFGIGAITVGLLSLLLIFFWSRQTSLAGLAVLMIYHLGICITQGVLNYKGFNVTYVAFHGFLVLSLLFLLIQAVKQKE